MTKLLAILVALAVLLGGCATAPAAAPDDAPEIRQPPAWLMLAWLALALLVGFGLALITPISN